MLSWEHRISLACPKWMGEGNVGLVITCMTILLNIMPDGPRCVEERGQRNRNLVFQVTKSRITGAGFKSTEVYQESNELELNWSRRRKTRGWKYKTHFTFLWITIAGSMENATSFNRT